MSKAILKQLSSNKKQCFSKKTEENDELCIHNDVDPRLIHLKIDSLSNRQIILTSLVIAILILSFYMIGITVVPTAWQYYEGTESCESGPLNIRQFCKRLNFREDNVWEGYVFGMDAFDQFMVLEASPIKDMGMLSDEYYEFDATVTVQINKIPDIDDNNLADVESISFEHHSFKEHTKKFRCANDLKKNGFVKRQCDTEN